MNKQNSYRGIPNRNKQHHSSASLVAPTRLLDLEATLRDVLALRTACLADDNVIGTLLRTPRSLPLVKVAGRKGLVDHDLNLFRVPFLNEHLADTLEFLRRSPNRG